MAEANQEKSIGFLKLITSSLKLLMPPQKIYAGIKQIFDEGKSNHKLAIFVAVGADLVSLFRILSVFLTLGSLIAISEFFEFIITGLTIFVLRLLLGVNISYKGYMIELVPYLDIVPTFTLMVLAQFEKDKAEGRLTQGADVYSGLTSGTDSYSFILIFVLMVGGFLGLGILISIFLPSIGGIGLGNLPGQAFYQAGQAIEDAPTLMAKISIWFRTLATAPGKWWDRQYAIATGGYYQGQVDQYADRDLGVFIENLAAVEEKFYLESTMPIQFFAEVRAETLETDDCEDYLTANETKDLFKDLELPIEEQIKYYQDHLYKNKEDCYAQQTVTLACGISGKRVNGTMDPETLDLFNLQGGASAIDCDIPKNKLSDGTEIVDVKATFPFVTKSYVKTYFMDVNRLRDMKRQKLDPLEFYQIKDKKPEPTYTGGPVMIGIGLVADLPITIDTMVDEQRSVRLGITLENKWEGKISNLIELKVIVPKELKFSHPLFQVDESGNELGTYVLSPLGKKQIAAEKGIETLKTYNGRIEARNAESAKALLNNIPLVTKYVKVTARYYYEIEESTTLRLEKGDGFKFSLSNCKDQCTDYDGCYCDIECEGTPDSTYGIVSGAGITGGYVTPLEVTRGYNCNSEYKEIVEPTGGVVRTDEVSVNVPSTEVASSNVANSGDVIGLDISPEMCHYCNYNKEQLIFEPWDPSAAESCKNSNFACCEAKCPIGTKLIKNSAGQQVSYINQDTADQCSDCWTGKSLSSSGCGIAALKMAMDFLGTLVTERELFCSGENLIYIVNQGSSKVKMKEVAQRKGLNTELDTDVSFNSLNSDISQNKPVIISWIPLEANYAPDGRKERCYFTTGGHIVTVVGTAKSSEGDYVIINDPATKGVCSGHNSFGHNMVISKEYFEKTVNLNPMVLTLWK